MSPDGTLLATGTDGGRVRIWRVRDGALLHTFQNDWSYSGHVEFTRDGSMVVGEGVLNKISNMGLKFWRVSDGVRTTFLPAAGVRTFTLSPNGNFAATGSHLGIQIRRLSDGAILQSWTAHASSSGVHSLSFSPDGRKLASGGSYNDTEKTVKIWNVADGSLERTLIGHTSGSNSVAFSPDGKLLASAGADGTLRLWDPASGELKTTVERRGFVAFSQNSVAFSPDGQQVVCGIDAANFGVWTTSGSLVKKLDQSTRIEDYGSAAFSPDGTTLVTAGNDIRLWNTTGWSQSAIYAGHSGSVVAVSVSPDGSLIATGCTDKTARVWDSATGKLRWILEGHSEGVVGLAFSALGLLASASDDATVKLWNSTEGVLLRTLTGHTAKINAVAVTADGGTVISASADKSIRLWHSSDGANFRNLAGHTDEVRGLALSPDESMLASASFDRTVKLWRLADGALLRTITVADDYPRAVIFSHNGSLVAFYGNKDIIRIHRVADGTLVRNIAAFDGVTNGIAFSTGDGVIAGSGAVPFEGFYGGSIKLWRISDGTLLQNYNQETIGASNITFSPTSDWLVYGRGDGTLVKARTPYGGLPEFTTVRAEGAQLMLNWRGGDGRYQLQRNSGLGSNVWEDVGSLSGKRAAAVDMTGNQDFFRVRALGY